MKSTLTKADIVERLHEIVGLNKREAFEFVEIFFEEITQALCEGHNVEIFGLGNFVLRDKKARPGLNPKTGERIEVSERRVVTFKAGKKLRQLMDQIPTEGSTDEQQQK